MKLLLDTNAFIWASCSPNLLTPAARSVLSDPSHTRYVSLVSIWEMQIKHASSKLPLSKNIDLLCQEWMTALAADLLPIELAHLGKLYDLPSAHRDPFDRLLIAQSMCEGMVIVSADTVFQSYPVAVVW